jgi:hypothetical protein
MLFLAAEPRSYKCPCETHPRIVSQMPAYRYKSALDECIGDFTSTDMAGEVSGDQPARRGSQAEPIWTTKGVEGEVSMNSPPEMDK